MKTLSRIRLIIFFGLIISCLYLQRCNPGGYFEELSGDYFYEDRGLDAKNIVCHLPNYKNIYANVIAYNYNSDFIIAKQQPSIEGYKNMIAFDLRDDLKKYPTNSEEEINQSEKEADSILKHDPYYKSIFSHKINYWIISHKDKEVYGPLTMEEYIMKRRDLNIPERLRINE